MTHPLLLVENPDMSPCRGGRHVYADRPVAAIRWIEPWAPQQLVTNPKDDS